MSVFQRDYIKLPSIPNNFIHIAKLFFLPELQDAYATGGIFHVCTRGGFELDINRENTVLKSTTIRSKGGKACKLKYGKNTVDCITRLGKEYQLDGSLEIIN